MASDKDFVEYVIENIKDKDRISYKKMFGEYAVYFDNKVVLLICDNRVFVKPTEKGRDYIGSVKEVPAYPGAKPSYLIEDKIEDSEWLSELIRITALELPEPKPKKRKNEIK